MAKLQLLLNYSGLYDRSSFPIPTEPFLLCLCASLPAVSIRTCYAEIKGKNGKGSDLPTLLYSRKALLEFDRLSRVEQISAWGVFLPSLSELSAPDN